MTELNQQHDRQACLEAHRRSAAVPAPVLTDGGSTSIIVAQLREEHRQRRFALKTKQKIAQSLESYIRRFATDWHKDMNEKDRARIKREIPAIIKAAEADGDHKDHDVVVTTIAAMEPSNDLKLKRELAMTKLAKKLPVYPWVKSVPGVGELGLATIVAEAGNLSNYPNVAKLWKRLGFAPYDGHAGPTWKRESWRPRALSKDEWIANPFDGERYGQMREIAYWLLVKQWIGKEKAGNDTGLPNGPYGEIYAARRARTKLTHPDWTDGHSHNDGLRVLMKAFLCDLWVEWRKAE